MPTTVKTHISKEGLIDSFPNAYNILSSICNTAQSNFEFCRIVRKLNEGFLFSFI